MMPLRAWAALVMASPAVATIGGFQTARVAAEDASDDGAEVVENGESLTDPQSTVPGVTPTPSSEATAVPLQTATPVAGGTATPAPTPAGQNFYISPGYGSATEQPEAGKEKEIKHACDTENRPPTSHMLGIPGLRPVSPSGSWVPILVAVAAGSALFAAIAFALRNAGSGNESLRPGLLEGIATLVAICTGLAGLAAQFIPSAAVRDRPPTATTLHVRDVKQRITRSEYLSRMDLTAAQWAQVHDKFTRADLEELGNVVWLEIGLAGFKGQTVRLQYGLYDLEAGGALLPNTARKVKLTTPKYDAQTVFYPAWVGYPRSARFKAEFRLLVDSHGLQDLAATRPMNGSPFRYACLERDKR
jgi:hypothetical protein